MKRSHKITALILSSLFALAPLAACTSAAEELKSRLESQEIEKEPEENTPEYPINNGEIEENNDLTEEAPSAENENHAEESELEPEPAPLPTPEITTVKYLRADTDGVNIRSGAGAGYSSRGTAEKNTLYAFSGATDSGWYSTSYKHSAAFVSSKYFTVVEMQKSDNPLVEEVIDCGLKCLGIKYVYGATRLHDGKGNLLKAFDKTAFDCSSLMQYIFYYGANINLDVNTRTQIYQGKTVKRADLKRGDLMFFTNASRKNNAGIERVGHVALYLGDGYILHTASDYAKIEKISSQRWDYFIQGQRIL